MLRKPLTRQIATVLVASLTLLGAHTFGGQHAFAATTATDRPPPTAWIYPYDQHELEISPEMYGVNNSWGRISHDNFGNAYGALDQSGMSLFRFPGGWESEWYNWESNRTGPVQAPSGEISWKREPHARGARASNVLRWTDSREHQAMFVLKTQDYVCDEDPTGGPDRLEQLVTVAEGLVDDHGEGVSHWEIGNEWFFMTRCSNDRDVRLERYAEVALELAKVVKDNDAGKVYVTGDVNTGAHGHTNSFSDFERLMEVFDEDWNLVDGVSTHIYPGVNPTIRPSGMTPLAIAEVTETMRILSEKIGSDKEIFVSEWAPALSQNNGDAYLAAANHQIDIMYAMQRGEVSGAAYWPPAESQPKIALLKKNEETGLYDQTALGQTFSWMSSSLVGMSVPANWSDAGPSVAVARDGDQLNIFVTGKEHTNKPVTVRVRSNKGDLFDDLERADVLYARKPQVHSRAQSRELTDDDISLHVNEDGGYVDVSFVINPGPDNQLNRGSSHEIVKITLSN